MLMTKKGMIRGVIVRSAVVVNYCAKNAFMYLGNICCGSRLITEYDIV
jgi:hypothetical protein